MSVSQYQNQVNSLDKEIAELERKKAAKDSEASSYQSKAISIERSITQNTSPSIRRSKERQISDYKAQQARREAESADFSKKIAEKRKRRLEAYQQLQKAEADERKRQEQANSRIRANYEARISELQAQLERSVSISDFSQSNRSLKQDPSFASQETYDVFVSHASEDKQSFVDEFVEELEKQGLRVWYDTAVMEWGDSIRESIDRGLSRARFGVVVLSPSYIAEDKYWTKQELSALFQRETVHGKVILPIWHNLTKKQVVDYSPTVADRKAMTTANMTPQEIAIALKGLLQSNPEGV